MILSLVVRDRRRHSSRPGVGRAPAPRWFRRWRFSAAFASLVALATAVGWSQDSRPPVELLNPTPAYPIDAWGSGIDPEVTVEVVVDEQGRVSKVEVVEIRPASAYDAAFASAADTALRAWRYAPRIEDGRPTEARLRWTLEFSGARDAGEALATRPTWWATVLGIPREVPSFLSLPQEQRERLLEEHGQRGLTLLDSAHRSETQTPRFVVHTDAGEETGRALGQNFEALFTVLDHLFAEQIPPRPERLKILVFAFARPESLSALAAGAFPSDDTLPGFYSSFGLIGMHLQVPTPQDALGVLLHEGTHAYVDRHLVRPGVRLPYWLSEGFAEYVGNSVVEKGRLVPGRTPRARLHLVRMVQGEVAVLRAESQARLSLAEVKAAVRRGKALTLAEMLDADRTEFYGERLQLYYGMSWLLVHYLRHGDVDWSEGAFPRLLLYAGEGFPVSAALEAAYRRAPQELEQPFRDYVEGF
ncbi:MAG: TonB family protein [Thermoanaerobaculia bacterium]